MKARICVLFLLITVIFSVTAKAENIPDGVEAKAAILIETGTGTVLGEFNADERLPIASVTKIMTMLLIMEAVDSGEITLKDMVPVSENAMSYGGSTMFLEAGEKLSVNDMLKGIVVASANDGCVAMSEYISGSESGFVAKMNERAATLGMSNTNFMNTNGLDEEGHYSSARDVAIMSRELLMKHPKIIDYTSIWTDELRNGKFQLSNTNKLVRFYDGAIGLKTGSTSEALCCLSAAAKRDNLQLIAVVLGSPTSEKRFASARTLLDYGFANYKIQTLSEENAFITDAAVINGTSPAVPAVTNETKYHLTEKSNKNKIESKIILFEDLKAPIQKGDIIGTVEFVSDGKTIEKTDLIAAKTVEKKSIARIAKDLFMVFM